MKLKITILALGASLMAQAQTQPKDTTLNRTVVVEQEYNPEIMDARKVNVLPAVEEITVTPKEVEYDAAISPSKAIPGAPMDAYAAKEMQEKAKQGYARFGYGNNGNLDAKANYLFNLSPQDKLNLSFAMDGMNGDLDLPKYDQEDWTHHYYQTKAGMDYLHQFSRLNMNVGGNFGLSNFNCQPLSSISRQKFTSSDLYFRLASTDKEYALQFDLGTNLLFYTREYKKTNKNDIKETLLRTHADLWGLLEENKRVGIYTQLENIFYNGDNYDNYTRLSLQPYYASQGENWKLRAGINMDIGFGFGDKLNISPNVTAEYNFSDSYVLYAKATGGTIRNDFRHLEQVNPYGQIPPSDKEVDCLFQFEDSYERINASIGFKASPFSGLWFNLYGGYQDIKNDLNYLSIYETPYIPGSYYTGPYYYAPFYLADANNFYMGAQFSYAYKKRFDFSLNGKYYSWDSNQEAALITKPMFHLDFQTNISLTSAFTLNAGYEYIKRDKAGKQTKRLDPVSNLSLGATYHVFNNVSIYARASNLLNKDYSYYWGYPAQGANFVGGLSFQF